MDSSDTIFEILNARGQELEDHELLKNYIMRYTQPQEQENIDEVKMRWSDDIDKGLGTSVKKFFKHYSTHRFLTSRKESIYKTIQKGTLNKDVNKLFDDILLKASYYNIILHPLCNKNEKNCSPEENKVFSFFIKKKAEQFRPIILSLMHQKEMEQLTTVKYNNVLDFLFNFFTCYNIIGEEKSNKLEDPIYKYSPILENNFTEKNLEEFIVSLKKRLPNEDAFLNIFKNVGYSNHTAFYKDSTKKDRVKLVLEILEKFISNRELDEEYTLEHILPDSQGEQNALIGNILPLEKHLNDKCKDKPLKEKIVIYKESNYAITRKFAEKIQDKVDTFDPKQRTNYLGKLIYNEILVLD